MYSLPFFARSAAAMLIRLHSLGVRGKNQLKNVLVILIFIVFIPVAYAQKECAYFAKETPQYKFSEWEPYQKCAEYVNGKLSINPEHLEKIKFDSYGLAPFWTQDQYFYIKKDGSYLPVIFFENGADYFREGLTRSIVNGKIAYYNQNFELVIPPKYDWGWPFSDGRALVCSGCSIQKPDEFGHKAVMGGVWGYINKQGEEVVPVKYSQSEVHTK
jgi:hypothetical protein